MCYSYTQEPMSSPDRHRWDGTGMTTRGKVAHPCCTSQLSNELPDDIAGFLGSSVNGGLLGGLSWGVRSAHGKSRDGRSSQAAGMNTLSRHGHSEQAYIPYLPLFQTPLLPISSWSERREPNIISYLLFQLLCALCDCVLDSELSKSNSSFLAIL